MTKFISVTSSLYKISRYLLLFLTVSVPLVFTAFFDNYFDLVKSEWFRILSSLLFISLCLGYLFKMFAAGKFVLKFQLSKYFDIPVILILLSALISTLFSINTHNSFWGQYLRQFGLIDYLYLTIIYFTVGYFIKKDNFNQFTNAMILSGSIASVYALLQYFQIDPFLEHATRVIRPGSTIGYPVFLSGFLLMVFPFTLKPFLKKQTFNYKYIPAPLIFSVIIISQTRSVYAALILQIIGFIILYLIFLRKEVTISKRLLKTGFIFIGIFALAVLFIFIMGYSNILISRLSIASLGNNPRFLVWRDSFNIIKTYFIAGTGIGNFSIAFESVESQQTILSDLNGSFDNAHSNYIHIFCTMGILGIASYLILLAVNVKAVFKSALSKLTNKENRIMNFIYLMSVSGYIIYGITDFDDLSITLYLFVILPMIKYSNASSYEQKLFSYNISRSLKKIMTLVLIISIIFCTILIFKSISELKADRYEAIGKDLYYQANYKTGFEKLNKAIELNPECSEYRLNLGSYVYDYCFRNDNIPKQPERSLLLQAIDEVKKGLPNAPVVKNYKSLLSQIYYELGDEKEGDRIKNEIFGRDSLMIPFKVNLARMYLKKKDYKNMFQNLEAAIRYNRNNAEVYAIYAGYYEETGDIEKSIEYINKILSVQPYYPGAAEWKSEMERKRNKR